jgi:hypothetical protein
MDQLMTQPWGSIRARYSQSVAGGLRLSAMVRLTEQIEGCKLRALFGWTSMHDLCIVQTPVSYPYDGPYLRISPLFNGTLEFRYIDTYVRERQWRRVVNEDRKRG